MDPPTFAKSKQANADGLAGLRPLRGSAFRTANVRNWALAERQLSGSNRDAASMNAILNPALL